MAKRAYRAGLLQVHSRSLMGAWLATVGMLLSPATVKSESVVHSPHNLSASSTGTVRAVSEQEVCIFCHTPHGGTAQAPLWNRTDSGEGAYVEYRSTTAKALFGQPSGASKLCLSCHDGTVALGLVHSRKDLIEFSGGIVKMPPGRSNLGTDLSDDHPISFIYDSALYSANGELKDPAALTGKVRLDRNHELQCTACHNAHDNRYTKFLVMDNAGSALCITCHAKRGWSVSSHALSVATWNGTPPDPWTNSVWTTVAANGCSSCHMNHSATIHERLLNLDGEEQTCYQCHNGTVGTNNIQAIFLGRISIHPVDTSHPPGEPLHSPTENVNPATRHVECADCHNAHAVRNDHGAAPAAQGALAELRGWTANQTEVRPLTLEYQLCFRCHSDGNNLGPARVPRVVVQTNTRKEFDPSNASFHPVEFQGKLDHASLVAPYTEGSMIYCSDCHNNDDPNGPRGPHGSSFTPILERRLEMTDSNVYMTASFALCYKCHDEQRILSNAGFSKHSLHIVDAQAACTTCHDSHGVAENAHLINFNTDYVKASTNSVTIRYTTPGNGTGSCTLSCHGKDHGPLMY